VIARWGDLALDPRTSEGERRIRGWAKARIPSGKAAAMILIRDGKVLIGRRPEGKLLGGLWEFPGGKLEAGETLEGCLQREILEELEVRIHVDGHLASFDHGYSHYAITLHAYQCHLPEGEPQAFEHDAIHWVPISELGAYPIGKLDRQIARLLQRGP